MTPVRAVVLDIEGTTGSISHVRDVLFPYARARIGGWFAEHRGSAPWRDVMAQVHEYAESPHLDEDGVLATLADWSDRDVKAPPLKHLQALIWSAGYTDGTLHGHVYDEVPAVLAGWHRQGLRTFVYSSGSVAAQRSWFGHTPYGDLTGYLDGYFDLRNAGSKTMPASYATITAATGFPAARTCFFSDVVAELDAAARAGWATVGVRRDGDDRGPQIAGHRTVSRLDDIDLLPSLSRTGQS